MLQALADLERRYNAQTMRPIAVLERIVSGYRTPEYQAELKRRWETGDRDGLVAPPAEFSHHAEGTAVDLWGSDRELAALGSIWTQLGYRWGGLFLRRDPVHFDMGG